MELNQKRLIIEKIYDMLLCVYILVAPTNNLLREIGISINIAMIALPTVVVGCLVWISSKFIAGSKHKGYGAFGMLVLLLLQAKFITLYIDNRSDILVYLPLLCFCVFVMCPTKMPTKLIFCMIYISTILSAAGSVAYGSIGGSVERTAALVDGSIAVLGIVVVLFAKEEFNKTRRYNLLKMLSFISCLIVAAFGMSRSRIFMIVIMIALKGIMMMGNVLLKKRLNAMAIMVLPLGILALIVIAQTELFNNLMDAIELRYSEGFADRSRDMEIRLGWTWFKENWFLGTGWGILKDGSWQYNNHCAYVAVLARGGLFMGIVAANVFLKLLGATLKTKNMLCIAMLFSFFFLSYGNAGFFNYTITGAFIPLAAILARIDVKKLQINMQQQGDKYTV